MPSISFTAPPVCEGNITTLTATSNHPISSYLWNIDITTGYYIDPPYSDNDNPTQFKFDNASASHMVSVTLVDNNNCSNSTLPTPVEIWNNPQAIIDIDPNQAFCLYEDIQINDNSTYGSGTINYWDWNFGSNANPPTLCCTSNNASINYSTVGWKTISLSVEDNNTCVSNTTEDIYINQLPNAYFTTNSPICCGETVEFTNQSSLGGIDNYFTKFDWEFYDPSGNPSIPLGTSQQNPNNPPTPADLERYHDYVSNIIFTVGDYVSAQLTVTDIEGCTSTYNSISSPNQQNIEIHPLPNVDFTVEPVCEGENFIFEDKSYMNSSIFPADYLTNINTNPLINPIFNYNGLFNSNTGNMNGGSWTPPIWTLPTTSLSANNNNIPTGVPVILKSETDFGCTDSKTINAVIKLQPNIDFNVTYLPNNRCGTDVEFSLFNSHYDLSSIYTFNYEIFNYINVSLWSNSSNLDIIDYNFDLPGIYQLFVELDNKNGCIADSIYNIYINPNPAANFTPSLTEECEDVLIDFTDASTIPNNNTGGITSEIISWMWDLDTIQIPIETPDNGNTSFNFSSVHSPYDIYLTVTTDSLCTNSSNPKTITVHPTPLPDFVTNLDGSLPGSNGQYLFDGRISTTNNGSPAIPPTYSYSWEIEDGNYIVNIPNDIQLDGTEDYGYYWYNSLINDAWLEVCLFVENEFGCIGNTCKDVKVDHFNNLIVPNFLYPTDPSSGASEFLPKGKSLETYRLQIFDKFGNLIWETTALDENGSPKFGWKGTSLNGIAPQGTYVWRIDAAYSDGEPWLGVMYNGKYKKSGIITLVR